MIKEAIEYIVGLREPFIKNIEGHQYSDKPLTLVHEPKPVPLETATLQSVVDFIEVTWGKYNPELTMAMIHVVSPTQVNVISRELRNDGIREVYLVATCPGVNFAFGNGHDQESFIINLQTKFVQNDDLIRLLKLAGNIKGEEIATLEDDGVTQTATFRSGKSFVAKEPVQNPWKLAPFRTFPEVKQPESTFFLRLKSGHSGISLALHEVSDHAWEREAVMNIAEWFSEKDPANKYPIIV